MIVQINAGDVLDKIVKWVSRCRPLGYKALAIPYALLRLPNVFVFGLDSVKEMITGWACVLVDGGHGYRVSLQ